MLKIIYLIGHPIAWSMIPKQRYNWYRGQTEINKIIKVGVKVTKRHEAMRKNTSCRRQQNATCKQTDAGTNSETRYIV